MNTSRLQKRVSQMNILLLMLCMTRYFILNTHTIICSCALVVSLRERHMLFINLSRFSLHCLFCY